MTTLRLSQIQIDHGLPCPDGKQRVEYCDTEVPGLLLEVRATSPTGGTWYLRYKRDGKTAYQHLGCLADTPLMLARQKASLLKAERKAGMTRAPAATEPASPTLVSFWEDSYEPHVRTRLRSYGKLRQMFNARVRPRFGDVRLVDLRRQDLQTWHNEMPATGVSKTTADHHLKLVRQMLNMAVEWGVLAANPVGKVKLFNPDNRKLDDCLSDEEMQRFLEVLRTHKNRSLCQLTLFLLATGARLREALRARWSHIDRTKRVWMVPPEHSKSKRHRPIVLNDAAIEILDMLGTEEAGQEVFINRNTGRPLKWVHKSFDRLTAIAGVPHITPHSLRRNFARQALDAGASIYALSKLLGHASVDITVQRYASMSDAALFEAANGASKVLMTPKPGPAREAAAPGT